MTKTSDRFRDFWSPSDNGFISSLFVVIKGIDILTGVGQLRPINCVLVKSINNTDSDSTVNQPGVLWRGHGERSRADRWKRLDGSHGNTGGCVVVRVEVETGHLVLPGSRQVVTIATSSQPL